MSLKYYKPFRTSAGYTLSVDNVRIDFEIDGHQKENFERWLAFDYQAHIYTFPIDTRDFKYKYLYQFRYCDDNEVAEYTMTLGYIFNGSSVREDIYKGFLDFNPNKLGDIGEFWVDYMQIKKFCSEWKIVRWDIALDIPSKREFVFIEKDQRLYEVKAYSLANRTEYLGLRNKVGRVKVYNKTLESKLPYDLTRIEVTCSTDPQSFIKNFPKAWDLGQTSQLGLDVLYLDDTDLVLLRYAFRSIIQGDDEGLMIFNSLGRRKKAKLEKFLLPERCLVLSAPDDVISQFIVSMETAL